MSDALSDQIAAFRAEWTKYGVDGLTLRVEAVEMMGALFASFEAQAKVLESLAREAAYPAADVVVEIGPARDPTPEEEAMLRAYADRVAARGSNVLAFPGARR